ncbi:Sucrose-phosphatase 2 [Micractinium conductrix]|uniref:Sucrose-phosphatase n=1 Tax=Micractinium conductrix TaxID=554055 RepID=A0A2P6VD65_9CHLO|nr:Sucrose-phosphatase 2 [Micractinium conductrix]|eukprot:PSC72019.1 Sucrose-phosphatase 2 [Micractinium conductrix]
MTGELARRARFMLVSDLDWTMVDHGDFNHAALRAFNRLWVSAYAPDSLLVFSTGRSPPLFHELAAEVPLLAPDILVCSVGTEILINGLPDEEWEAHLNEGWDRARAAACAAELPELTLQQESEQRPHKISYKLRVNDPDRVLAALRASLADAGVQTNVIYSGGEDLDILPSRASKGKALSFLLKQLDAGPGRPEAGVMVCGDSGNDVELFAVPGVHGCMVANAHAELRQWCAANGHDKIFAATRDGPGGILEALTNFSFLNPSPPDTVPRRQALVAQQEWAEEWVNGSVPRGAALVEKRMQAFAEKFEYVGASGTVQSRAQLAEWLTDKGHGCTAAGVASALAAAPPAVAEAAKAAAKAGAEPGAHSRMGGWLDRYSERQLTHGLWLARWMELWQPFAAGKATAGARNARWCSAVLRHQQDGSYNFEYMHESSVPRELARA